MKEKFVQKKLHEQNEGQGKNKGEKQRGKARGQHAERCCNGSPPLFSGVYMYYRLIFFVILRQILWEPQ